MEVSRAGHVKAAVISIAVILFLSVGCVLGYHYLVLRPVKEIVLRNKTDVGMLIKGLAKINGDIVMMDTGLYEMNQRLIIKDIQIAKLLQIQELFFLIEREQTEKIITLERRHLEVIRALAILQKNHWSEKKRFESSGIHSKEFDWNAFLKAAKIPEGESFKDSEKVIEKW